MRTRRLKYTCRGACDDCGQQHASCLDALKHTHRLWRKDKTTDLRPARVDGEKLSAEEELLVRTWEETPPDVTPWGKAHGGELCT